MSDSLQPMYCCTEVFPVHHQLPESTQTHVYWDNDAIQRSHPLSSPSPLAFNHSQHQGFFKWVSSSHQMAKVLKFQLQHQSFQWTLRTDCLKDWLVCSPCSPKDSQESSPTPQFKSISSLALSLLLEKAMASHSSTLAWKIPWMEEPGGLQSMGSWRVGHNWATSLSRIGEGNGNPLQYSYLENPMDGRAWWATPHRVAKSGTQLSD